MIMKMQKMMMMLKPLMMVLVKEKVASQVTKVVTLSQKFQSSAERDREPEPGPYQHLYTTIARATPCPRTSCPT